jgi:DNA-binding response OmpR family regulator
LTLVRPLVLLVEDDADTAALYQAMLAAEEWEVVSCDSAQAARNWWFHSDHTPQLLILDVRLPDSNGVELCQELTAALTEGTGPAVLMLSAHGDPRIPKLCRKAGARVFLDKLKDLDRLVDTAKQLLQEQSALSTSHTS